MRSQAFTNTFSGGMVGDIDPHEQPNNTYRYAIGGRLVYNDTYNNSQSLDENSKDGKTRSFVQAKGNKFALSLCHGYQAIGSTETREGAVIYSTNGVFGEIGFLIVNDNVHATGFAKYITLFNDRNDPNGDRLRFDIDHYISDSFSVYEDENIERVYFTDGYNQKRVINLKLFYDSLGRPYHNQINPCSSSSTYPKHISVHAFDERMDLVFPRIKYSRRIKGTVKSGQYQLIVKYLSKSGHSSVWSFDTRPLFVTDQKLDGSINIAGTNYPNAYKVNHHNRTMGASNVMTEEGMRWLLRGLDTRWDQIKVGYIYHSDNSSFEEINEYRIYDITSSDMVVDIVAHTGIAINPEEINQRHETQLSVGSTAQQENRTWDANIELLPDMSIELANVTIKPVIRGYKADESIEPQFTQIFNPISGRNDNDPATNSYTKSTTIELTNFAGNVEQYEIFDDYENYKGQQFSHLLKGYFRGETQPFAFLFLDRKGNPLFAQHIQDFTFPEQFETTDKNGNPTDWTLSRVDTDQKYNLRIMGAIFSNIQIPADKIIDKFGNLNVSGFMIVRTKRIPTIAAQGILVNVTATNNGSTETENDILAHPQEYWDNSYFLKSFPYMTANNYQYIAQDIFKGSDYENFNSPNYSELVGISSFANFHSPDILIQESLEREDITKEQMLGGQLQKVGFVHKAYSERVRYFLDHFYTKAYRSTPQDWDLEREKIINGRTKIGSKTRITLAILHDQSPLHRYVKFDPDTADFLDYAPNTQVFLFNNDKISKATQQPNSVIMKLRDWKMVDSIEGPNSRVSYPIVNWKITPDKYYGSEGEEESGESNSLDTRRYFSTGHYQPITRDILNTVKKTYKPDGSVDKYIFDDVEVWGGDCYVNLFDFTRLYPEYSNCVKDDDNKYPDYSISMITPIESKYNLALLYGRRFAANGVFPQQVSCGAAENRNGLNNGITTGQPEDWSYNRVLLVEESVKFYFPKPSRDTKIVSKQDSTIRWSPKKIYGEYEDSYRQKLVNDYISVDGSFGPIQKLINGFDYLYVIQERSFGSCLTRSDRFISTDAGEIAVTSGAAIGGIRYISKEYGTQHPNSVISYNNRIMFTDALKGKIVMFSQSGLGIASDDDLMRDPIAMKSIYLDSPITHKDGNFVDVIAGIDKENEDYLTTMVFDGIPRDLQPGNSDKSDEVKSFTIAFSGKLNKWHSYHHFIPKIYINIKRYLFTPDPDVNKSADLYIHNHGLYGNWYNKFYSTFLEFIVNPNASSAKVFDNAVINVNYDSFIRIKKITCSVNDNIHNINVTLNPGSVNGQLIINERVARFIEDSLRVILFEVNTKQSAEKPRLRGHFMKVLVEIDNSQQNIDGIDKQCSLSTFDTVFRISSPNQFS